MSLPKTLRFDLPAAYSSLGLLSTHLRAMLTGIDQLQEPDVSIYNIELAVDEIFTNIVSHAYEGRPNQWVAIKLAFDAESRRFMIELHDIGDSFDLINVPSPDLESLQESGYGLFLVQSLMDDMIYTTGPDGNHWLLIKQL